MSSLPGDGASVSSSPADAPKTAKKLKITADNGQRALGFVSASLQKRARVPAARKARLASLPAMPLDVLFEIFGHLLPLDVLHLARTTRALRRVLLHRSAAGVWRAALANVPALPPCPADMAPPAYASLAYEAHCHECLVSGARNPNFVLRLRLCTKCYGKRSVPLEDMPSTFAKLLQRCIPISSWFGRKKLYFLAQDKKKFMKEYNALPTDERAGFAEKKEKEMEERREHARACDRWHTSLVMERTDTLDQVREKRAEAIADKLREMGYGDELRKLPWWRTERTRWSIVLFHEHPAVKQPKLLTERVWKNIKPQMVEYMEKMKAFRLKEERRDLVLHRLDVAATVLRQYKLRHPTDELMPGPVDFWAWDAVKKVTEDPGDDKKPAADFAHLTELLPAWIEDWRQRTLGGDDMLYPTNAGDDPPVVPDPADRIRRLKLAVCVYSCPHENFHMSVGIYEDETRACMFWPEFMHHTCNWVHVPDVRDPEDVLLDKNPALQLDRIRVPGWCRRGAWVGKGLVFNYGASAVVRAIVGACGLDPEVVTVEEMDRLDPHLVCLKCSFGHKCDGERRVAVMSWRTAVQHSLSKHWGNTAVTWERVSDGDAADARALEKKGVPAYLEERVGCTRCRDTPREFVRYTDSSLQNHLKMKHFCDDGKVEKDDFYHALDVPPAPRAAVKMAPKKVEA